MEVKIRLKSSCLHETVNAKDCWHGPCTVRRRFRDGLVLIENQAGSVRAASREELEPTELMTGTECIDRGEHQLVAHRQGLSCMSKRQRQEDQGTRYIM